MGRKGKREGSAVGWSRREARQEKRNWIRLLSSLLGKKVSTTEFKGVGEGSLNWRNRRPLKPERQESGKGDERGERIGSSGSSV